MCCGEDILEWALEAPGETTSTCFLRVFEWSYEWTFGPVHLVSESLARLARRKAARSLISNTQSPTISANMEGQSLWRASPFRLVSDALWTNSWRYCSIMAARSDGSTVLSCEEKAWIVIRVVLFWLLRWRWRTAIWRSQSKTCSLHFPQHSDQNGSSKWTICQTCTHKMYHHYLNDSLLYSWWAGSWFFFNQHVCQCC